MMKFFLSILLMVTSLQAIAAIDVYEFESPEQEQRYRHLIEELRCPKCQNQNLAGSDAGVATDLKNRTFELLQQGKSDEEIRGYLVERYGDFITYKPPVRGSTLLLWAGPFTLLLLVAVVIIWRVRRRPTEHSAAMSAEEQVRLTRILNDDLSSKG
ncbi:MAG: cytochrome c-type biogenesis protein CcmH [Moraxellaceae bacterium]|jgi:cytochrome c-type biogenesis protein CcmH|nr:cytochrome c-type biogenesis protein CcmH [Moraxellaceae bacterium]HQV40566.1 cytochrome c-type biogenesis protein CcmH [Moraxellaceae bacterium]HQX88822.1 cytochrome c-type biogenesis protein CcmH [Moraxellaceae bacterium]